MAWRGGRSVKEPPGVAQQIEDIEIEAGQIKSVNASSIVGKISSSLIGGDIEHAAMVGRAAGLEALTGPVDGERVVNASIPHGKLIDASIPHGKLDGYLHADISRSSSLAALNLHVTPAQADLSQPWVFSRFGLRVVSITSATSITAGDKQTIYLCGGAGYTVDLPPMAAMIGSILVFKKIAGGAAITIDADGSETIDGAATKALSSQYDSIIIACDGAAWHILAEK